MSILKIARMGHPVLLRKCQPVADPGAPEIRRLAADMIETMEDAPGVGLAAPQVYQPLRLFVFRVQRDWKFIGELEAEVKTFLAELDEKVSLLRSKYERIAA